MSRVQNFKFFMSHKDNKRGYVAARHSKTLEISPLSDFSKETMNLIVINRARKQRIAKVRLEIQTAFG